MPNMHMMLTLETEPLRSQLSDIIHRLPNQLPKEELMTQGLLVLVKASRTVLKAVAGCNGYHAIDLARLICQQQLRSPQSIYEAALMVDFGCEDCLIVYDRTRVCASDNIGDLPERYARTFDEPTFNPRWHYGTADHTIVIDIDTWDMLDTSN